jgi:hypothetical protein
MATTPTQTQTDQTPTTAAEALLDALADFLVEKFKTASHGKVSGASRRLPRTANGPTRLHLAKATGRSDFARLPCLGAPIPDIH